MFQFIRNCVKTTENEEPICDTANNKSFDNGIEEEVNSLLFGISFTSYGKLKFL